MKSVLNEVGIFSPGTVANVACGFDIFGLAVLLVVFFLGRFLRELREISPLLNLNSFSRADSFVTARFRRLRTNEV